VQMAVYMYMCVIMAEHVCGRVRGRLRYVHYTTYHIPVPF